MGKVIIQCVKCGNDEWLEKENPEHAEDKICSKCGAIYCAKNRKWIYKE